MKSFRWLAALVLCGVAALALGTDSAAELLKSVTDLRADLIAKAQEKDPNKLDLASIDKQVQAKAEAAVKGVDPSKVAPAEALDWAQIFYLAAQPKDSEAVLVAYVATKPEPPKLFVAQTMLLNVSWEMKDDKTVAATLQSIKPYDAASSLECASLIVSFAPQEAREIGTEIAIELIDKSLKAVDQALLNDQMKRSFARIQATATLNKIEIYRSAGLKEKTIVLIDAALVNAEEPIKSQLVATKNQIVLVGLPAPALKVEHAYGTFSTLDALKGKVIVLDFFAHWCGPCKAAFSDLRQMLADLQPKGLEVIGVTQYYGYLGDPEKKLKPDEEYAKMADFVNENNITWPVVFGQNDNFLAYGVTAIPHVVVISRTGVVHSLDIGYSKEGFAEFRKRVEEFLGEK